MSSSMAFALKQRTFITNYLRLPVVDVLDHRALEAVYKVLFAFFQYAVYAFCFFILQYAFSVASLLSTWPRLHFSDRQVQSLLQHNIGV